MRLLKRLVPSSIRSGMRHWEARVRSKIRQCEPGQRFLNRREAKKLASSSKRLDLCAAQFAHLLHISDHPPLTGKTCLEIGSGMVLSHAVVCHLLGAKQVIATDVDQIAYPCCLTNAIREAIPSITRDILASFEPHHDVRRRLDALLLIENWTFRKLRELGIEYISPIDLAREQIGVPVDFIYSFSVLEHVPVVDIEPLLCNLASALSPGGTMIHCIHLEDHKDIIEDPFAFLSEATYTSRDETERGNRLRRSQWHAIFSQFKEMGFSFIYEWSREDKSLPGEISSSVLYQDEGDLRISHLGVYTSRFQRLTLDTSINL